MKSTLVEIAVFAPLQGPFYYRPPELGSSVALKIGQMVRVPFGKSSRMGVITRLGVADVQFSGEIKTISEHCDNAPIFDEYDLALGKWASDYYHQPIGEVLATMLPSLIRKRGKLVTKQQVFWKFLNSEMPDTLTNRAPRQQALAHFIGENGAFEHDMDSLAFDWRRSLRELAKKGFLVKELINVDSDDEMPAQTPRSNSVPLNHEQRAIAEALVREKNRFSVSLIHGVTGSGKTNVYIEVISQCLEGDKQALVLLPEIAITQQLVDRFAASFGAGVGVSHSGLGDKQRADIWTKFKRGTIKILLGTRSAVWVSAKNLSCIVVDEEHDPSYKQLEGFRYNARDVAVYRASRLQIPVVLGSATPSFESYRNATQGKYRLFHLKERPLGAQIPTLQIEDIRSMKLRAGLSPALISAIKDRIAKGQQTILFLNRRGYAPVMLCHQCGQVWECDRCDSKLVLHRERGVVVCHQCDKTLSAERAPRCCENPEMVPVGQGTEQLAEQLGELFPQQKIRRIDRDTVRKKSELDEVLRAAKHGEIDILLGTQMLAKGHDFPNVTLVGVVDADARLFSIDFRAEERLAQLIIQVAGRAGRAELEGQVIVQTRQPFHWIFDALREGNYDVFLKRGLAERQQANLPPFVHAALIRAEAIKREVTHAFLDKLVKKLQLTSASESIFGPIPSQMERRAGKYRAEIIFFASTRKRLGELLSQANSVAANSPQKNRVRWHIDVDPQDA